MEILLMLYLLWALQTTLSSAADWTARTFTQYRNFTGNYIFKRPCLWEKIGKGRESRGNPKSDNDSVNVAQN